MESWRIGYDRIKRKGYSSKHLLLSVTLGTTLCLGGLLLRKTLLLGELLGSQSLGTVVLADGLENGLLLLGLDDGDRVGEGLLGAGLALGVGTAHDLDLDTKDTLAEENVASSGVDELLGGLTGVNHETVLFSMLVDISCDTLKVMCKRIIEIRAHKGIDQ